MIVGSVVFNYMEIFSFSIMKEAELRKQLARICVLLLLYNCLKNLANHLMLLKKKGGREERRGVGVQERKGRRRNRAKEGRERRWEKGERKTPGRRRGELQNCITHHNHLAILNFSYKICFFAIPFLHMNEFVSFQANNRLRTITESRTQKQLQVQFPR